MPSTTESPTPKRPRQNDPEMIEMDVDYPPLSTTHNQHNDTPHILDTTEDFTSEAALYGSTPNSPPLNESGNTTRSATIMERTEQSLEEIMNESVLAIQGGRVYNYDNTPSNTNNNSATTQINSNNISYVDTNNGEEISTDRNQHTTNPTRSNTSAQSTTATNSVRTTSNISSNTNSISGNGETSDDEMEGMGEPNEESNATNGDDATVLAGNDPPPTFTTRVQLTMNINCRSNPKAAVIQTLRSFLTQGRRFDNHFGFLPWYRIGADLPLISQPDTIPSDFSVLSSYMPKLNPDQRKLKQTLYVSLFLQHSDDYIEMAKNFGTWLSDGQHKLYKQLLQVERERCIGSFCWSTKKMDRELLAEEIFEDCGVINAFQWKTIYLGKRGDIPAKEKTGSLHVIVEASVAMQALNILSAHYGKSANNFPNGRKLRFFPDWNLTHSLKGHNALRKYEARQKRFLSLLQFTSSQEILSLDISSMGTNNNGEQRKSLRQLISTIKSTEYPEAPLFVNVDTSFIASQGIIFEFLPHVAEEATMMARNLIPYFIATEGAYTTAYFHEEAVEAASSFTWDPVNKCVICSSDTNMDVDADEDIFGLQTAEAFQQQAANTATANEDNRPDPTNVVMNEGRANNTGAVNAYFSSNDSISTMGNSVIDGNAMVRGVARTSSSTHNSSSMVSDTYVPSSRVSDDTSMISDVTQNTINSILKDQQDQRRLLDEILARLTPQQTGQSGGPSQVARHGGDTADGSLDPSAAGL